MYHIPWQYGPRQGNLVLIVYASSEGSGEPAHPRSLARTSAARSYKQWVKRILQTENQIPSPSEWLGMRSKNLSWRNARRHKFAWLGPFMYNIPWQYDESLLVLTIKVSWNFIAQKEIPPLLVLKRKIERKSHGALDSSFTDIFNIKFKTIYMYIYICYIE